MALAAGQPPELGDAGRADRHREDRGSDRGDQESTTAGRAAAPERVWGVRSADESAVARPAGSR
jgi:hypothetical protein